ncbi:hypothetical protein TH8_03025 [Thalassospira profundimaris]|nr:hypothetical protein TH8_03025 [Thalassospira profundimaris]
MLGLAGGLAVIVSTRKQIFHSESVAQQQRRDFLLADFSKQLVDIENICVACIAFKDRALTFGASDDLKQVSEDIMESLRSEQKDYEIKRILEKGQSLQVDNLVPLPIQDPFNIMLDSLKEVWRAIENLEYGEASTLAKNLELSIDQVREALIAYRNEILGLRLT